MVDSAIGRWSCFSGHTTSTPPAADSLVYSPAFCFHLGLKEIKQDAAVPHGSCHTDHSTVAIMINITAFHLACQPPFKDSQPCATDIDSGLCGLVNACRKVTISYWHTDSTDSPMFSLPLMLPISDVRCANQPNSTHQSPSTNM